MTSARAAGKTGVVGCILAGGLARRMGGGDKALVEIGGKTLLQHVIERLRPQCDAVVLNINGDPARFADYRLPLVNDSIPGHAGPLAGILAGLEWAKANHGDAVWMVSVATDTPFFPADLVERFIGDVTGGTADMACAASAGRQHPVFGLWPLRLSNNLRKALVDEDIRKVDRWTARYQLAVTEFETVPFDPFFNVNRHEDVEQAQAICAGLAS